MPPEIRRRKALPPQGTPALRHLAHLAAFCAIATLAGCVSADLESLAPPPAPPPAVAAQDAEPGGAAAPGDAADAADGAVAPAMAYATPGGDGDVDRLITRYAAVYEVPEALVRRVVKRESNVNPRAYNRGHYGLMQIKPATARSMGYRGEASGLLDAETNLTYAVKYLRGAYLVAGGDHDRAVRFYASGYYYDAKRRGLLEETGLGKDRRRMRNL